MTRRPHAFLILGILSATLAIPLPVRATLGESADSIAADQKALSAKRRAVKAQTGYTVHEIQSSSSTVRQYVAPSGVVFGIAWKGLVHPDLTPLLGSYAAEYNQAKRHTPRQPGRRSARVSTDRVVVEKWGHMRNWQGRAFAPALIPSGVTVDEIK